MTISTQAVIDFLVTQLGHTGQILDLTKEFLVSKGYLGHINDAWFRYLGALGYTGSLNERLAVFFDNTYVVYAEVDGIGNITILVKGAPTCYAVADGSGIITIV